MLNEQTLAWEEGSSREACHNPKDRPRQSLQHVFQWQAGAQLHPAVP